MDNKRDLLKDEQLDKVNGGYTEKDLALQSFNKEIMCPMCHTKDPEIIYPKVSEDLMNPGNYYCENCKKYYTIL